MRTTIDHMGSALTAFGLLALLGIGLLGTPLSASLAQGEPVHGDSQASAAWTCRGEVQFRPDHSCGGSLALRVISIFPDGSRVEKDLKVGGDGNFVVTMEKGAFLAEFGGGSVCCGVKKAFARPGGVPRLQLETEPLVQSPFTFRSATGGDLQGLQVGWFRQDLGTYGWDRRSVAPDENGVFHISRKREDIWVQASADGHAMFARLIDSRSKASGLEEITLQPLARVSGKLVSADSRYPSTPWLWCNTPFRPEGSDSFTRRAPITEGAFDVWIPANSKLRFRVEQEYGRRGLFDLIPDVSFGEATSPALNPSQHLEEFDIQVGLTSCLAGRVLNPDGTPVEGAFVRGLGTLWGVGAHELSGSVPPHDLAVTDTQGRFMLFGDGLRKWNDLAVAVELPGAGGAGHGHIHRQHFEAVPLGKADNVLVFQPGTEVFAGKVKRVDGKPVVGATLHLTALAALKIKDQEISNYDPGPYAFMLPRTWLNSRGTGVPEHPIRICDTKEIISYTYPVTASDGTFRVQHLPPGPWNIRVEAEGCTGTKLKNVLLPGKVPFEIDLQPAGELHVTLLKADGTPARGHGLELEMVKRGPESDHAWPRIMNKHADQQGTVRFSVGETGTYELQMLGRPGLNHQVRLKKGELVSEVIRMPASGSVSGVLDWPGAPDRVSVQLSAADMASYRGRSRTHFGRFHIADLFPGAYTVTLRGKGLSREIRTRLDIPRIEVRAGQDCQVIIRLKPEVETVR